VSLLPETYSPRSKRMLAMSIQAIKKPTEFVEKVRDFEIQRQYHDRNPVGTQPQFGMSIENWLKLREEGRQEQQTAQLGQASRDISHGLSAPQDVPETGQAPAPGPVSPPELSGLGGGPAQQQPRSGSSIPQQPGVLSEQGFQEFGEPPQTQEQALGRLAEYQEAGAAPETTSTDALKQPAFAQYRPEKELAAEAMKVKREARITEDSASRSKNRAESLKLQKERLGLAVMKAKKDNPTTGNAIDGLFKSVNKAIEKTNKAIKEQEAEVKQAISGWDEGSPEHKAEVAALGELEKELQAATDAQVFVVNNYSADLTPGKVDLAISMAKQQIQNGTYNGIDKVFQQLRMGGGQQPQQAPPQQAAPALGGGLGAPPPAANPDPMGIF